MGPITIRACILSQGFFAKVEISDTCPRHLAEGPLNTRQLAERVMVETDPAHYGRNQPESLAYNNLQI